MILFVSVRWGIVSVCRCHRLYFFPSHTDQHKLNVLSCVQTNEFSVSFPLSLYFSLFRFLSWCPYGFPLHRRKSSPPVASHCGTFYYTCTSRVSSLNRRYAAWARIRYEPPHIYRILYAALIHMCDSYSSARGLLHAYTHVCRPPQSFGIFIFMFEMYEM